MSKRIPRIARALMVDAPFKVRLELDEKQNALFTQIVKNRKQGDESVGPLYVLVGWLYDKVTPPARGSQQQGSGPIFDYMNLEREGKISFTKGFGSTSVVVNLNFGELPVVEDGSFDGEVREGVYLVPVGEELLSDLRKVARMDLGRARILETALDWNSVQEYSARYLKAKITEEGAVLRATRLGDERTKLLEALKPKKDEKEKKP